MKKIKISILCIFLAALMCFGLVSCSAKPDVTIIVKVPTLTMSTYADEEVTLAYDFLKKAASEFEKTYEDANLTVEVMEFELTREDEEITDCFDTPNAPDVLYEDYFNMHTYIYTGRVVPLDGIISDELRSDIYPTYWDASTVDGKTYMMPFLSLQNTLAYNTTLFEEAGLDKYITGDNSKVHNWTHEEWEEVLSTLRENLPENIAPLMMYAGDEQGDTHIMTFLRMFGSAFFDENGRFNVNTPEGIEALTWIKESYDKGYFPLGADTLTISDNSSQFANGALAIYKCNPANEANIRKSYDFEIESVNFPYTDDTGLATGFVTGFEVFDNGNEEKLKASLAFVQYIYESGFIDYMAGGLPASQSVADKYSDDLEAISKYINNRDANWNFTANNPNWRGVRAAFYPNIQDLLYGDKTPEEVAAAIDESCNAAIEEGYAAATLHE